MTEFEGQVLADLRVLKSQVEQMIGIGQPSRLGLIEDRVMKHDQSIQRMKGMAAAFGGLLTIIHIAIDHFAGKR
jgi:hypothetical protein